MKIRQGFVSNSSSSSFILIIPDDFSIDTLDFNNVLGFIYDYEMYEEVETDEEKIEMFKKRVEKYLKEKYIHEYDESENFRILSELFSDYVICKDNVPSDCGSIKILDNQEIKKRLKI